jgi:hypothetical protein
MKRYTACGTQFTVGESAIDNWAIIAAANKDYYWLHLDKYPSAHIIIEIDVEPTADEIAFATDLVRAATPRAPVSAGIVWTQVSNLRRGSKPGEVYFKNNSLVYH